MIGKKLIGSGRGLRSGAIYLDGQVSAVAKWVRALYEIGECFLGSQRACGQTEIGRFRSDGGDEPVIKKDVICAIEVVVLEFLAGLWTGRGIVEYRIGGNEGGGIAVTDDVEAKGWNGIIGTQVPVLELGKRLDGLGREFVNDAAGEPVGALEAAYNETAAGGIGVGKEAVEGGNGPEAKIKG